MESEENSNLILSTYIIGSGKIVVAIINLLHFLLLIRLLSIEEYALLTIGFIIPDMLSLFGELGLDYASTHFISKMQRDQEPHKIKEVIRINIIIKILIGFFFFLIVWLGAKFIALEIYNINDERLITLIRFSSLEIFSRMLFNATISILLGLGKIKIIRLEIIIRMLWRTILSISLVLYGLTLLGPMIGFFTSNIIVVLFNLFLIIKKTNKVNVKRKSINKKLFSEMIKYGYSLLIYSFIVSIQIPIYLYILILTSNLQNLSYFKTAVDSAKTIQILIQSISMVLFPAFSKLDWNNEKDRKVLINNFKSSLKFSSIIILPITCILIIFSGDIFPFLYGDDYLPASIYYSMYFMIFLFVTFGSISIPEFLKGQKQTNYVLYIETVNIVFSVVFGLIFIHFYPGIGLIFGIILGKFFSVLYSIFLIYRKYGIILFENFKNVLFIFIIGILGALTTFFMYNTIISFISIQFILIKLIFIAIFSIFYLGLFLFLIGFFSQITHKELDFLDKTFKNIMILNKLITYLTIIEKKLIKTRK
ncbi:MAG: hypothetical protein EU529_04190 [Promethearchaeota archaeon]|nr:MAG: hypothetical protein EU529_04190 [Candidatus Lokiarchaeota archaeon]